MDINDIILHLKTSINKLDFELANNILFWVFGNISLYYIDNAGEVIGYTFNHKYMDGELITYYIKNNLIKPIYIDNFIKPSLNIPQWQILEYYQSNIKYYTKFIKTIALKTYEIISNKKRDINVGIVVSTRKDNLEKGNFLQLATIHILKTDNPEQICLKLYETIQNSKKKQNQQALLSTFINTNLNLDYIFNNHRNLSNFTIENKNFKKICSNYSLEYIQNTFHNSNCKSKYFIILDYDLDTNKYIISSIYNIIETLMNLNL